MKARVFGGLSLLVGLCLLLALVGTAAATAQGPEESSGPQSVSPQGWGGIDPFSHPVAPGERGTQGVSAPTVDLGEPGLSFRYVETFGETEVPYFEDSEHLNYPWGLAVDGTSIWIAERRGHRALKFTNAGAFVTQIGTAGIADTQATIAGLVDVAVDGEANVWLVDNNAHHILKYDATGILVGELGQTWNCDTTNHLFCHPSGIAFDSSGNIYVSDGGNARIQIFDSSVNYLATIGEPGVPGLDNGHFDEPEHITVFASYLYVADSVNSRVQIFDVSNPSLPTYVATIGVSGEPGDDNAHLDCPTGVGVDTSFIYIADSCNSRIQVFDRASRLYVATLGSGEGPGNDQFELPTDVAVDATGNIFVADYHNIRVQQWDSSPTYVRTYGTTGVPYVTDGLHYNRPRGVAVGDDYSLFVVEEDGHRLIKTSAAGIPQWAIGEAGVSGNDETHLRAPFDVAADAVGRAYVADAENHRVQIFGPDGSYLATLGGWGSGPYAFDYPNGLFVTPDGTIYVADAHNHRVQIYDSNRVHVATLGVTDVPGSDNAHFDSPGDVVVDGNGWVYVADSGNFRIQVFDATRAYVRTLGVTGEWGDDFDHFDWPPSLAADAANNLYVADGWNNRVQVFDSNGAYLTTIGGSDGNRTSQMRGVFAVAVDPGGSVYVADMWDNNRIQKFAPGVPGWRQVNINGFGERRNKQLPSLAVFGEHLYAGTWLWDGETAISEIWRTSDGANWHQVGSGFGHGAAHMIAFDGYLYVGTWDGKIWRTSDGLAWTEAVTDGFGDEDNGVARFFVYSNTLYVGTWNGTTGTQIWRTTNGTDWTQFGTDGLGDASNGGAIASEVFGGLLHIGIGNWDTGAQLWRTDGVNWTPLVTGGFGEAANAAVSSLAAFDGYLYAGLWNEGGVQVWRSQDGLDWEQVVDAGFGDPDTRWENALEVYGDRLYLVVRNSTTGLEVWHTADGISWEQVGSAGFGDSNNEWSYWDSATAVFEDKLYVATNNWANGGEVWLYLPYRVHLPLVLRDR